MLIGVTPSKIAMFFLKINVILFAVTIGVNTLAIFPYIMHINQVANNMALDIANKNYILEDDVGIYMDHLTKEAGEADSNTYSILTFKESDINGTIVDASDANTAEYTKGSAGVTAFKFDLDGGDNDYKLLDKGGQVAALVDISAIEGKKEGQSLIIDYSGSDFDPLNNTAQQEEAMNGTNMNKGILVNRGTPFKVKIQTRYKLTGGAFGFMLHTALPITAESIGVTTQYYQYDSE